MNEELNQVLIDAINKTTEGVGAAVDFAIEQSPDVIQQLLLWHALQSALVFGFALGYTIILVWIVVKHSKTIPEKGQANLIWRWPACRMGHEMNPAAVSLIVLVMPCLGLFHLDWLKIMLAPKLYLLEYAASLVK